MRFISLGLMLVLTLACGQAMAAELMPGVDGPRDHLEAEYAYFAFPNWQTAQGWDQECYYSTIQTADLDGDGKDEILGRSSDGLEVWSVDTSSTFAEHLATLSTMSDANSWDKAYYYETIQAGDINGDGKDEIIARNSKKIRAWSFDSSNNSFTELADGPAWSDKAGWKDNPSWYETIGLVDLDGDGAKELVGRDSSGLLAYKYDSSSDSWSQLATLTDLADNGFVNVYPAVTESLSFGNVYNVTRESGNDYNSEEVIMLTEDQGLAVFHYDVASDSWTTYEDKSGYFSDLNVWGDTQYADSIQTYEKYTGTGHDFLAARGTDGLGLYVWESDGWSLMDTLDYFSDDNGWDHGNYSRTITMTDLNGDGIADATGWHGDGVEALLCNDRSTGTTWTQMTTLGLSEKRGWSEKQFDSTIRWAELDGNTANGSEMLVRGSSGVRLYDYSRVHNEMIDFREDYPVFRGEEADAYDHILSLLRSGDSTHGKLLSDELDLRQKYGDIGVHDWTQYYDFISDMRRPLTISSDAWDNVVPQLLLETSTMANIEGPFYDARAELFLSTYAGCIDLVDEVTANVEYGAQSLDNQFAQLIMSTFIQSVSKAVSVVATGGLATMAKKVIANVAITAVTSAVSAATDSALFADPNLSSSAKLELEASTIKSTLDNWFDTNEARYNDQYADMASTWAGLSLANDSVTGNFSMVDYYAKASGDIKNGFSVWLYKTLMPIEYELKYTDYGDADGVPGQIYIFHADPPDYDMYRNKRLSDGNYKWTWIEHSPGTYPSESLMEDIWNLGVDEDDFFKAKDGWDFNITLGY